jgi:hypothetical protein
MRYDEEKAKHISNLDAWRASLIAQVEEGRAREETINPTERSVKNMQMIERRATRLVCRVYALHLLAC